MNQTIKNCCFPSFIRAIALAVAMGMVLVACGKKVPAAGDEIRIGIAVYQQSDTFISTVVQNMERLAREIEGEQDIRINLNISDGRNNQTVQLEQIDRFLDQGCDIICVNIVDRTAAAVLVDKAESAGVPLILFNRQPVEEDMNRWENAYYVGAQGAESGTLQGEIVRDLWQSDATSIDRNGDGILQYVMLEGQPSHQDSLLRTSHSVMALTDAEIPVEKLRSAIANWNRVEATATMAQWIDEVGGDIEVVFANNDDMALGAIDAYLAAGVTVENLPVVVGVDATPDALEAIAAGSLSGTVLNDSAGIAESMMNLALTLWRGKSPADTLEIEDGHYLWLSYTQITPENIPVEETTTKEIP